MDPVTIVSLVTLCISSTTALYKTIEGLQSRKQDVRNLKGEVGNLNVVLQAVSKNIEDTTQEFEVLQVILQHCNQACKDFNETVLNKVRLSNGRFDEFKSWAKIQYLGGDIDNFRKLIGSYKATLTIALADSNLRTVRVTKQLLETYTEMTKDATADLEEQITNLTQRLESHQFKQSPATTYDNRHLVEDGSTTARQTLQQKAGLEQCMTVCHQLLQHISQLQASIAVDRAAISDTTNDQSPADRIDILAPRLTADALQMCTHSLDTATRHLQELGIMNKVPDETDTDRIIQQLDGARQCLDIVGKAQKQRINVFENIEAGEGSFQTVVSTIGDLIKANGITIGARSTNIMGQMNDESLQKLTYNLRPDVAEKSTERTTLAKFEDRHGFGHTMHRART